jgi:ribosomal protein S18 acetylase RimI-like enzyme
MVREEFRRRGIARAMMKYILDQVRPQADVAQLDVAKHLLGAFELYKSLGFRVVKSTECGGFSGWPQYDMELDLRGTGS